MTKSKSSFFYRLITAGTGLAVLSVLALLVWWSADARGKAVDAELREQLLMQAMDVARAINPGLAKKLTFTPADTGAPAFERIGEQLAAWGKRLPVRGIYSLRQRQGGFFFGPETYPEEDPLASPPGTVYENPPPGVREVFAEERGRTIGPYADEYGTFVTALAPVFDSDTGEILMLVCLDVMAKDWQSRVHAARMKLAYVFLAALLVFAGCVAAAHRSGRQRKSPGVQFRFWIIIPVAAALLGTAAGGVMYQQQQIKTELDREMLRLMDLSSKEWRRHLHAEAKVLRAQMDHLASDPGLVRAYEQRDLKALTAAALPVYEELLWNFKITHCYVIAPDRTCFLRAHNPAKRGDLINRCTLLTAALSGEDDWGVELGPLGTFTLRYVRPWVHRGERIGYLELGMEVEHLIQGLARDLNVELVSIIHKQDTTRESYEAGSRVFGFTGQWDAYPDVVIAGRTVRELPGALDERLRQRHRHPASGAAEPFSVRQGGKMLQCGFVYLSDAAGRNVADLIVIRDANAAFKKSFNASILSLTVACMVFTGVLWLLWLVAGTAEKQLKDSFEALHQSEENYRLLYTESRDAILALSPQGKFVSANPAAVRLFGCRDMQDLIDLTPAALSPEYQPDGAASSDKAREMERLATEKDSLFFEWTHRRVDGTQFPAMVLLSRFDAGGRSGLLATVRDITLQKQTENACKEREAQMCAITDSAQDAIMMMDARGRISFWNAAAELILGHTREEAIGRDLHELIAPRRYHDAYRAAFPLFQSTGGGNAVGKTLELYALRKDQTEIVITLSLSSIQRNDGWYAVGIMRDETERIRSEAALLETKEQLARIINNSLDAIVVSDSKGIIKRCNRAFLGLLDADEPAVLGRHIAEFSPREQGNFRLSTGETTAIDAAFIERSAATIGRLWQDGRVAHWENYLVRRDGLLVPVDENIVLSVNELGEVIEAVGIIRDITERKRAELELLETNRFLEASTARANDLMVQADMANAAKSEFLANMSHEIRTPMNGVIGMTGLLLDSELSGEQRHYAEIVRSSGEALLSLINDILDFSKIEAKKLDLEVLDFNLLSLLEDLIATMSVRAHEKGLELLCCADPGVPPLLRGDPGRLRQILANLLGNAMKFTHAGEVAVRVALVSRAGEDVLLRFAVRDTGIGIPKDKIGLLFNKFIQADASTTRKYGGTGLGLAISRELAELMGGTVGVASEEGRGSEFWFTVRLAVQPEGEQAEPLPPSDLRGVRVLIVDDNATNREILTGQLTSRGMLPAQTQDGPSALTALLRAAQENNPFRIALIDMQMPGMDGETLGRAIKADTRLAETRMVMLTSLGTRGDARRFAEIGFAAYLTKPVRQQELFGVLAGALRDDGSGRGQRQPIVTRHSAREHLSMFAGCKARILLAEDNITNQQVALGILKKLGLSADAVANGEEALKALESIPYDLALMDVQMPVMDGLEAARQIRNPQSAIPNRDIPIIAMTAHSMQGDREKCLAAGMNDYLSKPVTAQALADALRKWLPKEKAGGTRPRDEQKTGRAAKQAPPVWDKAGMLDRLLGDEELIRKITNGFLKDIPQQIEALKAFIKTGDARSVERQAHTIKGASANVGGEALREVAFEMEKAGRAGDMAAVQGTMAALEAQFERLQDAILSATPHKKGDKQILPNPPLPKEGTSFPLS